MKYHADKELSRWSRDLNQKQYVPRPFGGGT